MDEETEKELAQLRREYTSGIWWITFSRSFGAVGEVFLLEHQVAALQTKISGLRRKHIRRGRPNKKGDDGG
jgi:hypothetical protein